MILKIDLWLLGYKLLNFQDKLSDDEESESESEEEEENSKKGDFITECIYLASDFIAKDDRYVFKARNLCCVWGVFFYL